MQPRGLPPQKKRGDWRLSAAEQRPLIRTQPKIFIMKKIVISCSAIVAAVALAFAAEADDPRNKESEK